MTGPWGPASMILRVQWGRMRLQTRGAHLPTSDISSTLVFSGKTELDKRKENRTGNQTDLGLPPVLRIIPSRRSVNIH